MPEPPRPTFSADDLIAALASQVGDGGLTSAELAARIGRPQPWVTIRLRTLWQQGRVEMVKAPRMDMIGTMRFTPTYRLRPA